MSRKKTVPRRNQADTATLRYFTVESANRALPLVRRIVGDIVREYGALEDLRASLLAQGAPRSQELPAETRNELEARVERVNRYLEELTDLGAQFKDRKLGLVDFPALHDGRPICLCWKLDEERVEHWHETTEGFADRKTFPSDS